MPIAGQVAIVGSAATRFGVLHDRGYLELLAEAARGAIADAGIEQDDLEAAWLGTAEPLTAALLGDAGTAVTEALDFAPRPVTRVSTFCCTGMEAVRAGCDGDRRRRVRATCSPSEPRRCVTSPREGASSRGPRTSRIRRSRRGGSAPGQFALLANRYLHEYDCTVEDLAGVAVKNHAHAAHNPIAQYSDPLTVEAVLKAPRVAEPLGLLDCTPTTDGAAAVVLTSVERAREHRAPVRGDRGNRARGRRRLLRGLLPRRQRLPRLPGDARGGRERVPPGRDHRAARAARRRRMPRLLHDHRADQLRGSRPVRARRGRGAAAFGRDYGRRRDAGQPLRRPSGMRSPGRGDRCAHDQGDRRPGPRSRGRASGRRRAPRLWPTRSAVPAWPRASR